MAEEDRRFVSRGGLKLDAALAEYGIDVAGAVCADLGCSTGGFVDCLLQRGAARVYAVDTAYGELAWKLRQDPRVVVMERRNALHVEPPPEAIENCDLVSLDLGWTKQERAIPAALRWLKAAGGRRAGEQESRRAGKDKAGSIPGAAALPGGAALPGAGAGAGARIVTLIKPHYESGRHRLSDEEADEVTRGVVEDVLPRLGDGLDVLGWMRSPIRGGKGKNLEHLAVMGWKSEG